MQVQSDIAAAISGIEAVKRKVESAKPLMGLAVEPEIEVPVEEAIEGRQALGWLLRPRQPPATIETELLWHAPASVSTPADVELSDTKALAKIRALRGLPQVRPPLLGERAPVTVG